MGTILALNHPLIGPDRKPIAEGVGPPQLTDALAQALLHPVVSDSAEVKYKKYKLWQKVTSNVEADFSIDELKLLKDSVGVQATPIICGQVFDLLEGTGNGLDNAAGT